MMVFRAKTQRPPGSLLDSLNQSEHVHAVEIHGNAAACHDKND